MVRTQCGPLQSQGECPPEKCSMSSALAAPPCPGSVSGIADSMQFSRRFSVTCCLAHSLCQDPDSRIHSEQGFTRHSSPPPPGTPAVGEGPAFSVALGCEWGGVTVALPLELCPRCSVEAELQPHLGFCQQMPALPCQVLPTNWCVISPTGHLVGPALLRSCPGTWTPFSAPTWCLPLPQ